MKDIQSHEDRIIGEWKIVHDEAQGDENCERIKWLTENMLKRVGYSKKYGAWENLYQDPADNRFWVKTYPNSEMHGGGPPALICISAKEANRDYHFE